MFGDNNNLLEDLSDGIGATPFIGFDSDVGLVGGAGGTSYTFLIQQNGDNVIDFTFDFVLTETVSSVATSSVSASPSPVFESLSVSDAFIDEAVSFESEVEFTDNSEFFEDETFDFAAIPNMFEVA